MQLLGREVHPEGQQHLGTGSWVLLGHHRVTPVRGALLRLSTNIAEALLPLAPGEEKGSWQLWPFLLV